LSLAKESPSLFSCLRRNNHTKSEDIVKNVVMILISMLFAVGSASAELINYGGFETGEAGGSLMYYNVGSNIPVGDPTGWTVDATTTDDNTVVILISGWEGSGIPMVSEGAEFMHIGNSIKAGGISQSFATNIGSVYELSLLAWNWGATGDGFLDISIGDLVEDDLAVVDYATGGTSLLEFNFTAVDTTSTLTLFNNAGSGLSVDAVSVVPAAPVEIVHTEGATLVFEENETTDSFTIVLTEEPNVPVTITVDPETDDVSLNAEAPNDAITLTFGTDDWDTPQAVTVKANDDDEAEGQETVTVGISLASDNPDFTAETGASVTVVDNDSASVVIEESDGSTDVIEGGATDSYTVVLGFAPNSDVTITIDDSGDPNQTNVDGGQTTTLTFTLSNWDTPQTVTVEAIDDDVPETQPHNTTLTHTVSQPSGDSAYDGLSVSNVSVSVGENDCGAAAFDATDINADCITDIVDFAMLSGNYLNCVLAICP